jgi:hypothetical protein
MALQVFVLADAVGSFWFIKTLRYLYIRLKYNFINFLKISSVVQKFIWTQCIALVSTTVI